MIRKRALVAAVLLAPLLAAPWLAPSTAQESGEFRAATKVFDWDLDRGIGTVKVDDQIYAFKVTDATKIRVDQPLAAGDRRTLEKLPSKDIWVFAEKEIYQAAGGRTVGMFRPRLGLCAGYGIEPLPEGRRRVEGAIGLLGWYKGTVEEWAIPGQVMTDSGLFDLGLTVREAILYGVKGTPDKIKDKKPIHIDGQIEGKMMIRKSGQVLPQGKDVADHLKIEVPVISAERIVIPHKAFGALYRYMWLESYMDGEE